MITPSFGEATCLVIAIKVIVYITMLVSESAHPQIALRSSILRNPAEAVNANLTSCITILTVSIVLLSMEFVLCLYVVITWEKKLWQKYFLFSLSSHIVGLFYLFILFDELVVGNLYGIFGFTIASPLGCLLLALIFACLTKK
ncbi:hypothetical protein D915_001895 [Fasciola hepatica]|uniref:Transmembrane protein 107 n=1 Tax=Fasciola hepatica TaxID=6192 RepID=A0A4E0RWQ6_FASHE|nr:hypothetical protein D915_001895 [Fasciola hepatica]